MEKLRIKFLPVVEDVVRRLNQKNYCKLYQKSWTEFYEKNWKEFYEKNCNRFYQEKQRGILREEIARDYVSKRELEQDLTRILNAIQKLSEKLDRMQEAATKEFRL